jgi:hypothetical protein
VKLLGKGNAEYGRFLWLMFFKISISEDYVGKGKLSMNFQYTEWPLKSVHTLDDHNSHINRDRIVVFCSDVLE